MSLWTYNTNTFQYTFYHTVIIIVISKMIMRVIKLTNRMNSTREASVTLCQWKKSQGMSQHYIFLMDFPRLRVYPVDWLNVIVVVEYAN